MGAFAAVLGAQAASSAGAWSIAAGAGAGILASLLGSLLFGLSTIRLKANEFITGLATNLLAAGLGLVLSQRLFGTKGVMAFQFPKIPVPGAALAGLPVLGPLVFSQDILTLASWAAVLAAWILTRHSTFGMRLRAAGSTPAALEAIGLRPETYRLAAILVSGVSCGLAGAYLSLDLSAYVPNISSGRGWIALVAIYLGSKKPAGILLACLVFATAESFSNYAQGFLSVPPDFILAIPYLVTLAALVAGALARMARR